jgi:hypothetical protein
MFSSTGLYPAVVFVGARGPGDLASRPAEPTESQVLLEIS